jgi:hypothetical protein
MSGELHPPAVLPPEKEFILDSRLDGPGLDLVEKRKTLLLPVLEIRSFAVQPVARLELSLLQACGRERRNVYKSLVGNSERKRVFGRHRLNKRNDPEEALMLIECIWHGIQSRCGLV